MLKDAYDYIDVLCIFRFEVGTQAQTCPWLGGTSDSDFTPHGKPAEGVLRRYYSAEAPADPDDFGGDAVRNAVAVAHQRAVRDRQALARTRAVVPKQRRAWQGWVMGSSEWSSPYYRLDSKGARASLDDMINMTHASAVEVIAQWYTPSLDSTKLYPITDDANPLRTSTDAELVSILGAAARRGLRTVLTPMVDLDVTLPNLTWCY